MVLAVDAIDKLIAAGGVLAGSGVAQVDSNVAVAAKAGAVHPQIGTEDALKQAVLDAATVGIRRGRAATRPGTVRALGHLVGDARPADPGAPGVPVGSLVARGVAAIGFQQLSELMHVDGVEVVGELPATVQITATFSAAVCAVSRGLSTCYRFAICGVFVRAAGGVRPVSAR